MMLRGSLAIAAAVVVLASPFTSAADATTTFLETYYYLLPLGHVAADVDSLRQHAQSSGFSVLTYGGSSVQATRAGDPVASAPESVLGDAKLLVIDAERFMLREAGAAFSFTVRPSEAGYELVIDPHQDSSMAEVLGIVLVSLQSSGILGDQLSLDVRAYAKADVKGPPPPAGAPIESTLHSLVVARDWFGYAADKGLALTGLRVEVVAELLPGASTPTEFATYVMEETAETAKLRVPIDLLIALARSSGVGYVRAPYRPSVP